MSTERETGMTNGHHGIVSALHPALQGAEAGRKYISDAEQQDDQETRVLPGTTGQKPRNRSQGESASGEESALNAGRVGHRPGHLSLGLRMTAWRQRLARGRKPA